MTNQEVETLLWFQHGLLSSINVALSGATREFEEAWNLHTRALKEWKQVLEDTRKTPTIYEDVEELVAAVETEKSHLSDVCMSLKKKVTKHETSTLDVIDGLFEGKDVDLSTCILPPSEISQVRDIAAEFMATAWRISQDCQDLGDHVSLVEDVPSSVLTSHDDLLAALEHLVGGCNLIQRNISTLTHANQRLSKKITS